MSLLPDTARPHEIIPAAWGRRVAAALRENRVVAGPGLAMSRTPAGTVIRLADSAPRAGGGARGSCDAYVGVVESVVAGQPLRLGVLYRDEAGNTRSAVVHAANMALDPARVDLGDAGDPHEVFAGRSVLVHRVVGRVLFSRDAVSAEEAEAEG
ncbi:MAG: hypothetical protein IJ783_11500 [Kiritimatiellae bacterium]|nr:hypothetical protein [Kiritimatiellia bacterium]